MNNGILLSTDKKNELKDKMNYLLDNYQNYDAELIKASAKEKFSYSNVGMQLTTIYKNSISEK